MRASWDANNTTCQSARVTQVAIPPAGIGTGARAPKFVYRQAGAGSQLGNMVRRMEINGWVSSASERRFVIYPLDEGYGIETGRRAKSALEHYPNTIRPKFRNVRILYSYIYYTYMYVLVDNDPFEGARARVAENCGVFTETTRRSPRRRLKVECVRTFGFGVEKISTVRR